MYIFKKIKRELSVILSKLCLRKVTINYLGLKLKAPILYGLGRGYIIPAELWMGQCLKAFLEIKSGSVIDVGANVGLYLVKLRVISSDTMYYGFEPNHVCNFYTQELVRLNNFTNALFFPFALSEKSEIKTLYAEKLGDKSASIIKETKENVATNYSFSIYTVAGDEFIKFLNIEKVSVIKIDVEGAEYEVLTGLKNTIIEHRPFLYCEVLNKYANGEVTGARGRAEIIYDIFSKLNYKIIGITESEEIGILESAEEFFGKYNQEYIFCPAEAVEDFKDKVNEAR